MKETPEPKKPRIRTGVAGLIIIAIMSIAISPQVVWLAALLLRPGDVISTSPPFSEAIAISAISGLIGYLVGAQNSDARKADESVA